MTNFKNVAIIANEMSDACKKVFKRTKVFHLMVNHIG